MTLGVANQCFTFLISCTRCSRLNVHKRMGSMPIGAGPMVELVYFSFSVHVQKRSRSPLISDMPK